MSRTRFSLCAKYIRLLICLAATAAATHRGFAATQLLALTGDAQPGGGGAQLQSITAAALNEAGQAALLGTLKVGVGGVTAGNSSVAWLVGSGKQLLARTGLAGAPGAAADPFSTLEAISIDDTGTAALSATLASSNRGVWRYPGGAGSLVALTNSSVVPGVANAKFDLFFGNPIQSTSGAVIINGRMLEGAGGVTLENDRGVWSYDAGSSLVTRKGVSTVPGVGGGKFQSPLATSVSASGQVGVFASLAVMDEVTVQNNLGLWRLGAGSGDLVARRGMGVVGGVPGASFDSFGNLTINARGQLAFTAGLALTAGVTTANRDGIWKSHSGPGNQLVVRSGSGGVPGVPGADFSTLGAPLLNDAGQILFRAILAPGIGEVLDENLIGLWSVGPSGDRLVARTGSGNVPGVPGASFADFGTLAFNESGFAAVRGTLALGSGGVSTANDVGLWILNNSGGGGVLIAREGGTLAGRTIADLDFTGGSAGGDGHARALNGNGQLLFKATFTNGDQGLFLYTPASTADFNGDGLVNAADLDSWEMGFGASPGATITQGDADRDGDVDGADFLLWQRQVSPSGAAAAAPEPATLWMLLGGTVAMCLRLNRGASVVSKV
jgi:hypothetical protein